MVLNEIMFTLFLNDHIIEPTYVFFSLSFYLFNYI